MALVGLVKVKIGDLRTPIEIQRFEHKTDSHGFLKLDWNTIAKVRAKIEFDDRLIRNVAKDDGVDTTIAKIFTMRYMPNITTKDRIIYRGKEYEIYASQNLGERDRFTRLWGREIEPTS